MYILKIRDENGEFIDIPAIVGPQGQDGYTPIKGVDYFDGEVGPVGPIGPKGDSGVYVGDTEPTEELVWIAPAGQASTSLITKEEMTNYVSAEIEKIELTPGPQGIPGKDGADGKDGPAGADGKTPVKGTDYWTEQDKAAIVNDVIAALPVYNGEVV